jgi:hypothetical protein
MIGKQSSLLRNIAIPYLLPLCFTYKVNFYYINFNIFGAFIFEFKEFNAVHYVSAGSLPLKRRGLEYHPYLLPGEDVELIDCVLGYAAGE